MKKATRDGVLNYLNEYIMQGKSLWAHNTNGKPDPMYVEGFKNALYMVLIGDYGTNAKILYNYETEKYEIEI